MPNEDLVELTVSREARKQDPSLPTTYLARAITYQVKGFRPQIVLTAMLDRDAFPGCRGRPPLSLNSIGRRTNRPKAVPEVSRNEEKTVSAVGRDRIGKGARDSHDGEGLIVWAVVSEGADLHRRGCSSLAYVGQGIALGAWVDRRRTPGWTICIAECDPYPAFGRSVQRSGLDWFRSLDAFVTLMAPCRSLASPFLSFLSFLSFFSLFSLPLSPALAR